MKTAFDPAGGTGEDDLRHVNPQSSGSGATALDQQQRQA
jgi:hypothetical protein